MFEAARETRVDLRDDFVAASVGVGDWNIVKQIGDMLYANCMIGETDSRYPRGERRKE
jgi:hypothetical protein